MSALTDCAINDYIYINILGDFNWKLSDRIFINACRLVVKHYVKFQYATHRYAVFKVKSETYKDRLYEVRIAYEIKDRKLYLLPNKSSCECKGFLIHGRCKHIVASMILIYLYPDLILTNLI